MRIALKSRPENLTVRVGDTTIAVPVRFDRRARRIILKIDTRSGGPVLTLPEGGSLRRAQAFANAHAGWIAARLARRAEDRSFAHGKTVPLRGVPHRIEHRPGRGLVRTAPVREPTIIVPGRAEHLSRRLHAFLRREARRDLERAVTAHARRLGARHRALRIGDQTSRWGSCSARGTLSFSWRLVLAPPHVLTYLAAHEVAHLREMHHGPEFWALVGQLDPDHRKARAWLRANGPDLHAIGRETPAVAAAGPGDTSG